MCLHFFSRDISRREVIGKPSCLRKKETKNDKKERKKEIVIEIKKVAWRGRKKFEAQTG